MLQNQKEAGEGIVDLYQILNDQRLNFKKKTLYQDSLGELIQKYGLVQNGQIDLFMYEIQSLPKGFTQTQQEVKEGLELCVDEMINAAYKLKLLQSNLYTHVSFGSLRLGQKSEIFKIAALVSKKHIALEGIIYCKSTIESGYLIGGRVLDPTRKPCMVVINRGMPDQIVLGPSKLLYSLETGEFRCFFQEVYYGLLVSDILQKNQNLNQIEVFVTNSNDNSFEYGQGEDIQQNFNGFDQMECGLKEVLKDLSIIQTKLTSLQLAIKQADLFGKQQNPITGNISRSRTSLVTTQRGQQQVSSTGPNVRKTHAQILREQNAQMHKSQQFQPLQQNTTGFNRSQTSVIGSGNTGAFNKAITSITPSFNTNAFKQSNTVTFSRNENTNPNLNNQQQVQPGFKFQLTQPLTSQQTQWKPTGFNSNVNNAFSSNISFKPNFNNTQTSAFSAFNQNSNKFLIPTQNQPLQPQTNNFLNQQPKFNFQFNSNVTSYQQPNTKIPTIVVQQPQPFSQPKFNINFKGNGQSSFQPYNSYNSTTNSSTMQIDNTPIQQQLPFDKHSLVFAQLSLIDQQTLQGYLKELEEDLTPEQCQKLKMLMLTEPVKFYEYFKIAHEQLQQFKKEKKKEDNQNEQQDQQEKKKEGGLKDIDDITLFLMNLPMEIMKNKQEKFMDLLKQLKAGLLTAKQVLKKLIIRNYQPINESFQSMMNNKENADLILILRNEEHACHQIVFSSTLTYFKEAIKESRAVNRNKYGCDPTKHRLSVPDWMDTSAFKLFINYVYSGRLNNTQMEPNEVVNLLRIANYFMHKPLQEALIADVAIQYINPQSAVLFLKECLLEDQNHRKNCNLAWTFLREYSQFYLTKHLSLLIRQNPQILYDLPSKCLRSMIDKSLLYVVNGSNDLETILQFTADTWADRNICKLFNRSQMAMDSCSAFDFQIIPKLPEFLRQINPTQEYQSRLIKGEDLKSVKNSQRQLKLNESSIIGNTKASNDSQQENEVDIANWKTSGNILKDFSNQDELFNSKEPQYQTSISLDTIRSNFENNKGCSVFSKAFDFARRSWILKIDIDFDSNISVYLVERGSPMLLTSSEESLVGLNIPIKFSSILSKIEVVDASFGDHRSLFFHSFCHDQNQTVGHENMINLSQLQNKNFLNVKIYMYEIIIHSALMHYLSQNFQELYKKDLKTMDSLKKSGNYFPTTYGQGNHIYDIMNLKFYSVFQLLQSDHLKVEEENTVLSYIYYYTRLQSFKNNYKEAMGFISDMLAMTLRFYYVSTGKIISCLRDNPSLRQSQLFLTKVNEEFNQRINSSNPIVLNIPSVKNASKEKPRKHYDMEKIAQEGRKKLEIFKDKPANQLFIEELMDWLKSSKHIKGDGDQLVEHEIRKWQNLYYEEKKKVSNLQSQQFYLEKQIDDLNNMMNLNRGRKSRSLEKLRSQYDQQQYNKAQTMGYQFNKIASPIRPQTPVRYQQQAYGRQPTQVNNQYLPRQNFNNSFDQSLFMNKADSLVAYGGGSTAKADRKLNQKADYSRLLANFNSPVQSRRDQINNNNFVPYYRQNRYPKNDNRKCEEGNEYKIKMERQFNLQTIGQDLKQQFNHESAQSMVGKCTKNCFISLKQNQLLPTEERCLKNCFVKSFEFQEFFENEQRYFLRNLTA